MVTPGPVCDPADIIQADERRELAAKISQVSSNGDNLSDFSFSNIAPACRHLIPPKNLDVLIAIIDKVGTLPIVPVDIEKFAHSLFQSHQFAKGLEGMVEYIVSAYVQAHNDGVVPEALASGRDCRSDAIVAATDQR